MKKALSPGAAVLPLFVLLLGALGAGCQSGGSGGVAASSRPGTFASVRPLLESNCAHCHGAQRLPTMPALADTKTLATLIGPGKLIVPGAPERSRFFQVVTLADDQAGAMPPTGHAISQAEVANLRAWIQGGAPLPAENVALTPRGTGPRSL